MSVGKRIDVEEKAIEKRVPSMIKERGQYFLAFGIIISMLAVTNIPFLVIFFFGVFAYFVIKLFSGGPRADSREVFEFYLSANEILRDDDRRWFGFELRETIERGENIIRKMSAAPPLVYFALGALYNKLGEHKAAVKYLSRVVEKPESDESAYVYPTPELRQYVKVLRRIEREPADAPLTSAAIRSLERARKLRGASLLEESRERFSAGELSPGQVAAALPDASKIEETSVPLVYTEALVQDSSSSQTDREPHTVERSGRDRSASAGDPFSNRKPITELLHDIYDKNPR